MIENKGFFIAMLCLVGFYNLFVGGFLAVISIIFLSTPLKFLAIAAIGLFFGWKSASIMEYFKASSSQMIINGIVTSLGVVFLISAAGTTMDNLGPILESPDDIGTEIPTLFGTLSFFLLTLLILIYIASFNIFSIMNIYRDDKGMLKYYLIGMIFWASAFLLGTWLSQMILSSSVTM